LRGAEFVTRKLKSSIYNEQFMPRKRSVKVQCPICKKGVKSTGPNFPFCSDRCRTIDLGKWASGAYVISAPVPDTDDSVQDGTIEDRERNR